MIIGFPESVEKLKAEHRKWLLLDAIYGSKAFGTDLPTSDTDISGVYCAPRANRYSTREGAYSDEAKEGKDTTYFELAKFFTLALTCNPTIIDLMFLPESCILYKHPLYDRIMQHRHLFLSRQAFDSYTGYAFNQIKKAKGQNKWINQPQPEAIPKREAFCKVFLPLSNGKMPMRPVPLTMSGVDLTKCRCSSVEHVGNMYRLYYYEDETEGVFKNGGLCCSSIPIEDETTRFIGVLLVQEHEYDRAKLDWKNYWTWVRERNPNRWVGQDGENKNFDLKNLMHCMRLVISGENILMKGMPKVRFEGEERDFLMKIRLGQVGYDEIMREVEMRVADLKLKKDRSILPEVPDYNRVDDLFLSIVDEMEALNG